MSLLVTYLLSTMNFVSSLMKNLWNLAPHFLSAATRPEPSQLLPLLQLWFLFLPRTQTAVWGILGGLLGAYPSSLYLCVGFRHILGTSFFADQIKNLVFRHFGMPHDSSLFLEGQGFI